jgi:hypothetical protein
VRCRCNLRPRSTANHRAVNRAKWRFSVEDNRLFVTATHVILGPRCMFFALGRVNCPALRVAIESSDKKLAGKNGD